MDKNYVTIDELAEMFGISRNFCYQRSRTDELPGQVRMGRFIRVDPVKFEEAVLAGDLLPKERP